MIKTLFSLIFFLNSAYGASIFIDLEGLKNKSAKKVQSSSKVLSLENRLSSNSVIQIFKNDILFKTIVLSTGESRSIKLPRSKIDKFYVIGVKPPTESDR